MNNFYQEILILIPILVLLFTVGWFYSFKTKVFSWIDFVWSSSFIVIIFFHQAIKYYNGAALTFGLIEILYIAWSLRLSWHLFHRIKKHGEDRRYVELKNKWKVWYGLYFFIIFQIEALLSLILALPLFLTYENNFSNWQLISLAIFIFALLGETLADHQLKRFLETRTNSSQVCNVGLWKFSRHPNYFFEWHIWISFGAYSLSSGEKWPGLIPAVVMYFFLTKITGIPYAEASSLKSKGEKYMAYQKKTNAFFPWFPKTLILLISSLIFFSHSTPIFAAGEPMTQQEKIKSVFNNLRADNLYILDDFYDPQTEFIDPVGSHLGIESVKSYYKGLYENVKDIHFEYRDMISQGHNHVFVWKMVLTTPGLNGGEPVTLEGNSHIKFNEKNLVIYHRDYFDMGEFIYEHIPVLGWTLKKIKNKLRGDQ